MQSGGIEQADLAIADAAAPARTAAPVKVAGWLSEIADQPQLITLCTAILLSGAVRGDRRLAATGGRMLAAELLATAMKDAIKHRIDRTRPEAVDDGTPYVMEPGDSRDSEHNSFPSGHTAGAIAVASVIAGAYPRARLPAYVAAAAIAFIQIPRSKHYVSDLAAGGVIGGIAGYLATTMGRAGSSAT
ncbi:phosphatase PAP2 family protein [Sphingomonas sp. XXL09]|uniref:phosphatase PAP2 family protein n=1 Tax=Sphingomonas sp. XXL09 TaxID=3457787 RepID=UPI00406BD386